MRILDRGPDGKYIGFWTALAAWLPHLLDHRDSSLALADMLEAASLWCDRQAAMDYQAASAALTKGGWTYPQKRAEYCACEAALWFARKAILLEAKQKLAEVK